MPRWRMDKPKPSTAPYTGPSTSSTTGAMSLSLSYTKKEYSITQTDGTPEFITENNNTGLDVIKLSV